MRRDAPCAGGQYRQLLPDISFVRRATSRRCFRRGAAVRYARSHRTDELRVAARRRAVPACRTSRWREATKGEAMRKALLMASLPLMIAVGLGVPEPAAQHADGRFRFAVSGDSRNCGDVVMPAIAAGVRRANASFYWHLGDFRAIYTFDEDITHQQAHQAQPLTIIQYREHGLGRFHSAPGRAVRHAAGAPGDRQSREHSAEDAQRLPPAVRRLARAAAAHGAAADGRPAGAPAADVLPLGRARRRLHQHGQCVARSVRRRAAGMGPAGHRTR